MAALRNVKTLGVLALAAAVAVPTVAASGSSGPADRAQPRAHEIRVVGVFTGQTLVDNDPAGESPGDLVVFTEDLMRSERRVGSMAGSCVLVTPPATFQCTGIARLAKGRLTLSANVGEGPATGAITGGTGKYRKARGVFRVEPLAEGRERITFRIYR